MSDDHIVDNRILKTTQVVIKGDDVLFKAQTARQINPSLVTNDFATINGEPFVETVRCSDDAPDHICWGIYINVTAHCSHVLTLTSCKYLHTN